MVAQFMEANIGGSQKLKVWTNTFLAETWEEEFTKPIEMLPLMKRAESYTQDKLPNGIIIAIAAVDVQKRWLQVEVVGLGLDDETWGIETNLLEGDPEGQEVWDDLAELISKNYTRQDGMEVKIHATAIDMKHKSDRVIHFVKYCGIPRVYPVYGVGSGQTLLVTPRLNKHYLTRCYAVDSQKGKEILFARLAIQVPGARYTHFPIGQGYNEEYFLQLTAEVLKTRYLHGFPTLYYEKIRDRNEALDIRVYLLATVDILKPNLTTIAKKLKAPGEQRKPVDRPAESPAKPTPTVPSPTRQRIRVGIRSYSVFGRRFL
jgi:phage terminase large subunit GpA-like protein